MWVWIWLGITILALIVEFLTSELVSIWFAGGGLISLILAVVGVPWYIQIGVFVVVSALSLLLFRRILKKHLIKDTEETNVDSIVGKELVLLEEIDLDKIGSVKVNDVVWSAAGETPQTKIEAGKTIKVLKVSGNKLIVKEV